MGAKNTVNSSPNKTLNNSHFPAFPDEKKLECATNNNPYCSQEEIMAVAHKSCTNSKSKIRNVSTTDGSLINNIRKKLNKTMISRFEIARLLNKRRKLKNKHRRRDSKRK